MFIGENGQNVQKHKEDYSQPWSNSLDMTTINILVFILLDIVCICEHKIGMMYNIYIAIII